jgi:hypothetical protein
MSNWKNRIGALEQKNEIEMFHRQRATFANRSEDELQFYATHGSFPEVAQIPGRQEFIVGGWKTTVTLERL